MNRTRLDGRRIGEAQVAATDLVVIGGVPLRLL
jgi:hypothetical protein